jgi:hypothetical protein
LPLGIGQITGVQCSRTVRRDSKFGYRLRTGRQKRRQGRQRYHAKYVEREYAAIENEATAQSWEYEIQMTV